MRILVINSKHPLDFKESGSLDDLDRYDIIVIEIGSWFFRWSKTEDNFWKLNFIDNERVGCYFGNLNFKVEKDSVLKKTNDIYSKLSPILLVVQLNPVTLSFYGDEISNVVESCLGGN